MKNKLSFIFDFWVYCRKLVKLTYPNNKPENWKVTWAIWNEESLLRKYDGKLFGFEIKDSEKKKREEKEKRKNNEKTFDELKWMKESKIEFECQIWSLQIDIDKNLQCLAWSQTFWFDWLISWMFNNSTCPNWRWELTKEQIRPNTEIKRQIREFNNKNQAYPTCNEHKLNWEVYWTVWNSFVWAKWIASNVHKHHEFIETKGEISRIQNEIDKEL